MAKPLSSEQEKEREELDAFLGFFITHVHGIAADSPIHPNNTVKGVIAQFGPSKALAGLRQAINDVIEATRPWQPAAIEALNAECSSRNLVTLSELRRRYSNRYKAIVKRGRVRSETEYYLVARRSSGYFARDNRGTSTA